MVPDGMALAGVVLGREVVDGIEHLALVRVRCKQCGGVQWCARGRRRRGGGNTGAFKSGWTNCTLCRSRQPASSGFGILHANWSVAVTVDERFEPRDFFARLSPSSIAAFNHADGMRLGNGQDKLHMEHLVMGLYLKENGPAQGALHSRQHRQRA